MARHDYDERFIANFDESMYSATDRRARVIVPSWLRTAYTIKQEAPFHITIGSLVFADGSALKPLLILPLQSFPASELIDYVDSFSWSGQGAGWITREIFKDFIEKVFIPKIQERRRQYELPDARALLFLDGHTSREDPDMLESLVAANIDAITFIAHTTHTCQPLDVTVFGALKARLSESRYALRGELSTSEKRKQIVHSLEQALGATNLVSTIKQAWRRSGLYPFNPWAVLQREMFEELPTHESGNTPISSTTERVNINGRVLTGDAMIQLLRDRNIARAAAFSQKQCPSCGRIGHSRRTHRLCPNNPAYTSTISSSTSSESNTDEAEETHETDPGPPLC